MFQYEKSRVSSRPVPSHPLWIGRCPSFIRGAVVALLSFLSVQVPLSEVAEQFFPPGKNGPGFKIKVRSGGHRRHLR